MQLENVADIYPLSPMQQGMLFHTLKSPEAGAYFQQVVFTFAGHVDEAALRNAWQTVIDRHAILRTCFVYEGLEEPLQVVRKHADLPWQTLDWRHESAEIQQIKLADLLQQQRQDGFTLSQAPLLNCTLIRTGEETYQFIHNHHHLLLDAWSNAIVMSEVTAAYTAYAKGQLANFAVSPPYRPYIEWLQEQDSAESDNFWRTGLAGFTAPTPLLGSQVVTPKNAIADGVLKRQLSLATSNKIRAFARQQRVTVNTLMQAAWALLLSRYAGLTDVVFGSTTAGRPPELANVEAVVGLFINTLPIRLQVPEMATVGEWLQTIQTQQLQRDRFAHTPLVDIQGQSEIERTAALFNSVLVYESAPATPNADDDVSLQVVDKRFIGYSHFPLLVEVLPADRFEFTAHFMPVVFTNRQLERYLEQFDIALGSLVESAEKLVSHCEILSETERRQQIFEWNNTDKPLVEDPIHRLVSAQASRTPNKTAIICGNESVTFSQLDAQANQVAHRLIEMGVTADQKVGLCVDRSTTMLVALLGILKAGASYVPLDPAFPIERLHIILQDSSAGVLVTKQPLTSLFPAFDGDILLLDSHDDAIKKHPITEPDVVTTPSNLAFNIFTSGSTGRPKGVMIPHAALVNLILGLKEKTAFSAENVVLNVASVSFDIAMLDIFISLVSGALLVVAKEDEVTNPQALINLIDKHDVTVLQATPTTHQLLLAAKWQGKGNITIETGGEPLPPAVCEALLERSQVLWNLYGPTETTIYSTGHQMLAEQDLITVGHPIDNTQVYLLDDYLRLVPQGAIGRLFIGGIGLARGYVNRPKLSAEKFIPSPFITGERIYDSGDLARYTQDGRIEILGRADYQVKIRGYRIELGEIESVLGQHDAIKMAAVTVNTDLDGTKSLIAYYTTKDDTLTTAHVHDYVKSILPAYMLPSRYLRLDAMPLTPNEKIDRKQLPHPDALNSGAVTQTYVAPRNAFEEEVVEIWQDILTVSQVGVHDNFFDLGGHSVLMMRLASEIQEAFEIEIPLVSLFEAPTVEAIADLLFEMLMDDVDEETLAEMMAES